MSWDHKSRKQYNPKKEGYGNPDEWQNDFKQRMYANEKKEKRKKRIPELEELYNCKTISELKSVYRRLVNKYHPDKAGDTPENNKMTQNIIETYNELKLQFNVQ